MKKQEIEYLNKLFAGSSEDEMDSEVEFPLLDVPINLTENLHAIAETKTASSRTQPNKLSAFLSWPTFASVAASLLMAVVFMQVYQQRQTLKQLEQAQTDLATALHYLGEANKITRAQMFNALNENMKKAAVEPMFEIGRDAVLQTTESIEFTPKIPSRTL